MNFRIKNEAILAKIFSKIILSLKQIKVCKTIDDLYDSIDKNQLTTEFGGLIHYRHQEWIEQRQVYKREFFYSPI